jgi:hypothetical protein
LSLKLLGDLRSSERHYLCIFDLTTGFTNESLASLFLIRAIREIRG